MTTVRGACRTVTIGDVAVTVYASEVRRGGITIDIDAPEGTDLLVTVNDGDVYRDEVPS